MINKLAYGMLHKLVSCRGSPVHAVNAMGKRCLFVLGVVT